MCMSAMLSNSLNYCLLWITLRYIHWPLQIVLVFFANKETDIPWEEQKYYLEIWLFGKLNIELVMLVIQRAVDIAPNHTNWKKKTCDKYLYDSEDKQLEYEPPSLCYLMYWVQTMWY